MTDQGDLRERLAEIVYDAFPFDGKHPSGTKPVWTPRGNSIMQDEARKCVDRILASGLIPQWQDIESAPKDGLVDLLFDSGARWTDCYWDNICQEWRHITATGVLLSVKTAKAWMLTPTDQARAEREG